MNVEQHNFGEPLARVKPAECVGEACRYYGGIACQAQLELIEPQERAGQTPVGEAVSVAVYVKRCANGQAIDVTVESPNGLAGELELGWRRRQYASQRGITLAD